ncbi:response regulator [Mongoliimonas terrestris]|uniref:response regulator n=1 Tax=Mongoliimonas terrestris TaxID=1709001 RepID=UPI000949A577|nr:response regulator [Mongoliimonas terrestris]
MSAPSLTSASDRTAPAVLLAAEAPLDAALTALLADAGFVVRPAGSRAEALAAAVGAAVAVVDTRLADGGGFPLLEALRADPATRHLPVILLVGRAAPVEVEKAGALGAAAILTKPFAGADLLDRVRRLCGANSARPDGEVHHG